MYFIECLDTPAEQSVPLGQLQLSFTQHLVTEFESCPGTQLSTHKYEVDVMFIFESLKKVE